MGNHVGIRSDMSKRAIFEDVISNSLMEMSLDSCGSECNYLRVMETAARDLRLDDIDECDDIIWVISKIGSVWIRIETQKDARVKLFYTATLASLRIEKLRVIPSQDHIDDISLDLETLDNSYLKKMQLFDIRSPESLSSV